MAGVLNVLRLPAIIALPIVLPIGVLEFLNQPDPAIPLLALIWLLTTAFVAALIPMLQSVRAGEDLLAHPLGLSIRVLLLALIAMMWAAIVVDQLPCFLGVPNCD
jgi:hypothetical protein